MATKFAIDSGDSVGGALAFVEPTNSSESSQGPKLVVAIDFGTYASGYAFQWQKDHKQNKLDIHFPTDWSTNSGGLRSYKTPTCLLLGPDESFESFGYEAEEHYLQLENNEVDDWYFFKFFKMMLHNEKNLTEDTEIVAANGKGIRAITVFAHAIEFIKKHFEETLEESHVPYSDAITRWVITVPAIWNERAKQLMRRAAEKAGIKGDLKIALEPEAAAIYCIHVSPDQLEVAKEGKPDEKIYAAEPGSTVMVVDMGGGTVDIAVVYVKDDGSLKQTYQSNGGDWGGMTINKKFENLLGEIVGTGVWEQFVEGRDTKLDTHKVLREFESLKRHKSLGVSKDDETGRTVSKQGRGDRFNKLRLFLPESLKTMLHKETGKKIGEIVQESQYRDQISVSRGELVFDPEIIKDLFEEVMKKVISHLKKIVDECKKLSLSAMVLVGGFAESSLVIKRIREEFRGVVQVVRPQSPGQSVLKGAVLFGHNTDIITARVLCRHYGVGMSMEYDEEKHTGGMTFQTRNGKKYVHGVFRSHAAKGSEVRFNEWSQPKEYYPLEDDETETTIYIYTSTADKSPGFITDPGCEFLGTLTVKFSNVRLKRGMSANKTINVSFAFGGTEIKVRAVDKHDPTYEFETVMNLLKT